MELNEYIYIDVDKKKHKKKKVKAFVFTHSILNRGLALHEDIDDQNMSTISDIITGYKLCSISKPCALVEHSDIIKNVKSFIKHYTTELILEKLSKADREIFKFGEK